MELKFCHFTNPRKNVERRVHILKEKCRYALLANISNKTMLPKLQKTNFFDNEK